MRRKFDITAIGLFSFALILIVFNCGFNFISENKRFIHELSKYQADEDKSETDET